MSAVIQSQFGPGTYGGDFVEPAAYEIRLRDERIAALEATVERMTAPVTEEEADRTLADLPAFDDYTSADAAAALTAFLERRMKG